VLVLKFTQNETKIKKSEKIIQLFFYICGHFCMETKDFNTKPRISDSIFGQMWKEQKSTLSLNQASR